MIKVSFLSPAINKEDIDLAIKSIRSGWLAPGPYTKEFENLLNDFLQVKGVAMLNSCTSALHLSLILAGVKTGDEVITTPLTYVATSNAILHCGATPIFVDVDSKTGLLDLKKIEKKITKKTKAIIPVHLYGQMINMRRLKKIADKYHLKIIEDAAHALEASRDGYRPGQLGFAACFSFHAAKNITSGQGGALASRFLSNITQTKILRRDGVINKNDKRLMVDFGYKYDTADYQAALLIGQLKRIKHLHRERQIIYHRYEKAFAGTMVNFPKIENGVVHSYHMFVALVDFKKRDRIRKILSQKGIETSIHYSPVHLEPYYQKTFGYKKGDFPVAEKLGSMIITLPTYGNLSLKQQNYIINNLLNLV